MIEPIRLAFEVACPVDHAFATWTERASIWWPASHTVSAEEDLQVSFEPFVGGRIYERTPAGEEHDWGRVVEWEPPRRVAYLWHIYGTIDDATDVEIMFEPAAEGTVVRITQSGFERLGAKSEELRRRNVMGWQVLVGSYWPACA
jgi:uncharacterized protein YndB with AHSA1/START domain